MSNIIRNAARLPVLTLLLGCALLAGCKERTNVSATGSTPAQFTHVFLTVNQIWFNTNAGALSTDTSWTKFTLTTPATVDLVALNNGTLSQFASELNLAAGTYAQVVLVLADSTDALTTAAQTDGAVTNDEVDYLDGSDVAHTVPLAVLNAAQGITVSTSLVVASSTSSGFNSTSTATSSTVTSSSATATGTFGLDVVATTDAIVDFDATRDLIPISLSGQPAYALNPHPHVYNAKYAGSIQGSVDLSVVTTLAATGVPDVEVSAETLSGDGTRYDVIKTTNVTGTGTFSLYPLSTASGDPTQYDLVIHGPNIQTVIIKSVPVVSGAPGTAAAQMGTLSLSAAVPFEVNINSSSPVIPAGSLVGFYQTLPGDSAAPYLIETRALDPVSNLFATDQSLSGGSVQYGTYVSGGTISLTNVNPSQGAGTYAVGVINPAYGAATLGTTVTAPATPTTAGTAPTALFTMTAPALPSGSTAAGLSGTINVASPGNYTNGELFLTHGGALVAAIPLDSYLRSAQSTLSLTSLAPGGGTNGSFAAGLYAAEVWAWNSANPTGTLVRIPYGTPIDMTAGDATGVALNVQ